MKSIIVQIYEVQTPHEAEALIELGVDHIGSVILSKEEWKDQFIKDTINLIHPTGSRSSIIPLFRHQESIFRALDYYRPDIVHFCDALPDSRNNFPALGHLIKLQENLRKRFPELKIMRSMPIPVSGVNDCESVIELARMFAPASDFFLTDTLLINGRGFIRDRQPVEGFIGITGRTCNWEIAGRLIQSTRVPVILAGGISDDNVFEGIIQVRPAGVDSCTRTNAVDPEGRVIRFKKDLEKVKRLIKAVRRAESFIYHEEYKE